MQRRQIIYYGAAFTPFFYVVTPMVTNRILGHALGYLPGDVFFLSDVDLNTGKANKLWAKTMGF